MGRRNKVRTVIQKREHAYGLNKERVQTKNTYIRSIINARYFTARCNMIADQIIAKKITEKIDSRVKSEEYIRAEYALTKMQAIVEHRNAHFAKKDLFDKHQFTVKDIDDLEEDYYNGKIIRESYDESYKKINKAEFVQHDKKTQS